MVYAKEAVGIEQSVDTDIKHKFVYDGSTENRIVYEFIVDDKSKYIVEHPFDKYGRGKHFHILSDEKINPFSNGTYNQLGGHFPENIEGFK